MIKTGYLMLLALAAGAAGAAAGPIASAVHASPVAPARAAKPAASTPPLTRSARRGLAFAQERCAVCHAVTANAASPNPESPPFEAIANMPGLTAITLRRFLSDSHNYPDAMNFTLARARNKELADYVLTLRRADYRPEI